MVQELADELIRVVDEAAADLRALGEGLAAAKGRHQVWSIKEVVGHLIDSAANNQHRFIRAQHAHELTFPGYDQDAWVRLQGHQHRTWLELVDFWVLYNHHLAHTIRRIPDAALNVPCRIGTDNEVPLGFLLHDYLRHLRHHLGQIQERSAL